jgi:hypothetical protein
LFAAAALSAFSTGPTNDGSFKVAWDTAHVACSVEQARNVIVNVVPASSTLRS